MLLCQVSGKSMISMKRINDWCRITTKITVGKYPTGDLARRKTVSRLLLHRVSRENLKCRMDSGRGATAFIELQIVEQIRIQSKQVLITWVREITQIK